MSQEYHNHAELKTWIVRVGLSPIFLGMEAACHHNTSTQDMLKGLSAGVLPLLPALAETFMKATQFLNQEAMVGMNVKNLELYLSIAALAYIAAVIMMILKIHEETSGREGKLYGGFEFSPIVLILMSVLGYCISTIGSGSH
jgi:hypothetical protein